jgi:hypothetical protein
MICNCRKTKPVIADAALLIKIQDVEDELVSLARNILCSANDPVSAVIKFLHERPENSSLTGYVIDRVLKEAFGEYENIPVLLKMLAAHVREIIRHSNVINVINEHPAVEKWGDYIIKQTERIKFEIKKERDFLVLENIAGISAIEYGIAIPIEKITIKPPKLIVTLNLGILRPSRVVDI